MRLVVVPALLFFLVPCEDAAQPYQRGAKFLRPTRTSTVVETSTVTAWVASSCVKMPSTLAPCRSARFLYFSQSAQQENQTIEQLPGAKAETVGWAEYFDIFPTVTVTATQLVTTTVTDPEVVATYVVNNCVPKFLPSSLPRCEVEPSVLPSVPPSEGKVTSSVLEVSEGSAPEALAGATQPLP